MHANPGCESFGLSRCRCRIEGRCSEPVKGNSGECGFAIVQGLVSFIAAKDNYDRCSEFAALAPPRVPIETEEAASPPTPAARSDGKLVWLRRLDSDWIPNGCQGRGFGVNAGVSWRSA
jgi:hypothetical protein